MTDTTRRSGDHTPDTPDTRGGTVPAAGHATAGHTGSGAAHGTDAHAGDPRLADADRATDAVRVAAQGSDAHGTRTPRAAAQDTGTHSAGIQGTGAHGTGADHATTKTGTTGHGHADDDAHLFPHDASDKLGERLRHAVAGFVDGPRASVEEADQVLEEIAARFTEAVTERRRSLRRSWQTAESGRDTSASAADTEQLRLALKDYRELAERLLHV
ncbi:hypothetical protein [Streptomyces sp. AHA2]|uniref:hypothetical protein n=1 Tax=Streptomyces sp. AHA2 TaxID=3064526 RepID=UPI002FDFC44E